ncbi:hypothetical protein GQ649_32895 [Rhodococcus sp. DSM 6344]|nr:hypothetical protein [Rhodococcus erythropolis]
MSNEYQRTTFWHLTKGHRDWYQPSTVGSAGYRWKMFLRGQRRGSVRTEHARTRTQSRQRWIAVVVGALAALVLLVTVEVLFLVLVGWILRAVGLSVTPGVWIALLFAFIAVAVWIRPTMLWRSVRGSSAALVMCRHWRGGVAVHGFVRWPEDAESDVAKLLALDVLEISVVSQTRLRTSAHVPQLLAMYEVMGFVDGRRHTALAGAAPRLLFDPARVGSDHLRTVSALLYRRSR